MPHQLILACSYVVLILPCLVTSLQEQTLQKRQSSQLDRLGFCYGDNSICSIGNDLFSQCDAYNNDYKNPDPWYKCLCSNGYVAVNEACYWCQLAYDLDISYAGNANKEGCSSASVSIAPIPSSILRIGSSFNATYTGPPPPGDATTTPRSSMASTTDSESMSQTTKTEAVSSRTGGAGTYFGGSTAVATYSGGAVPTSIGSQTETATATATQATASSSMASSVTPVAQQLVAMLLAFCVCLCASL